MADTSFSGAKLGQSSGAGTSFGGGSNVWGTSGSLGKGVGAAGAAVGDLFAAGGLEISAAGYRKAAGLTQENMGYLAESTRIKKLMTERQIYQTLGGQESDIAGAGLAASGSALDLFRDSAAQGELTRQIVDAQGKIDMNALQQQLLSYNTQADAADNAAEGKYWSAAINTAAAVASFGSFFGGG